MKFFGIFIIVCGSFFNVIAKDSYFINSLVFDNANILRRDFDLLYDYYSGNEIKNNFIIYSLDANVVEKQDVLEWLEDKVKNNNDDSYVDCTENAKFSRIGTRERGISEIDNRVIKHWYSYKREVWLAAILSNFEDGNNIINIYLLEKKMPYHTFNLFEGLLELSCDKKSEEVSPTYSQ